MTQFFIDRAGSLSNGRRTAIGGYLVDATLAKVGVMEYVTPPEPGNKDGFRLVRRYNPPATLQDATPAVATAPVTRLHPARFVDTKNYGALAKGHVVGTPEFVDGHIRATLAINDESLIKDIESGKMREVSMGYMAEHDERAGVTDGGESYDESRVKITWNHIAIVPAGRAGKSVRLMLDSAEIPQEDDEIMLKINGIEVKAEGAQVAFDTYDAGLQAQLVELKAQVEKLQAAKDAAEAELAAKTSTDALDAAVKVELAKREAKAQADARRADVAKAFPSIDLADKSEAYIDGLFAALAARPAKDSKDVEGLSRVTAPAKVQTDAAKPRKESAQDAYERMRAEERAASHAVGVANPEV